jgi:hypothetical protein
MCNSYRGHSIDASYQFTAHLAQQFQRRRYFKNQPIRNKNCLWWPCLLTDRDEISNLYRGPSIDASYQVTVHLAKRFQRCSRKNKQFLLQRWHLSFYSWYKPGDKTWMRKVPEGTCKVRNEMKPNEKKRNETKCNKTKQNVTKRNVTKKTKRNQTKQNETKWNEMKRNVAKKMKNSIWHED